MSNYEYFKKKIIKKDHASGINIKISTTSKWNLYDEHIRLSILDQS